MSEKDPSGTDLWESLERSVEELESVPEGDKEAQDLFESIDERADTTRKQPKRLENIEQQQFEGRDGKYYVLANPVAGTHIKLTPEDFYLWELMDGKHSIKDLTVEYFMKFGALAIERIELLIKNLEKKNFLEDNYVDVFELMEQEAEKTTLKHKMNRLWMFFMGRQFAFKNVDNFFTKAYDNFVYLFSTRIMKLLYVLISIVGVLAFIMVFSSGRYLVFKYQGSYAFGIILLFVVTIPLILIHELAHGFSCKAHGRRVRKAGVMLYYGAPAYFVDTTDIWMADKKARIKVSWAGLYSGIVLGSILSIIMLLIPDFFLNDILYKLAVMGMLFGLVNLNPLLEFDGYYMLMDYLEMPCLREKSFEYMKNSLSRMVHKKRGVKDIKDNQTVYSPRERRIFTTYGVLAGIWSAVFIIIAILFYQIRFKFLSAEVQATGGAMSWGMYIFIGAFFGLLLISVVAKIFSVVFTHMSKLTRSGSLRYAVLDTSRRITKQLTIAGIVVGGLGICTFLYILFYKIEGSIYIFSEKLSYSIIILALIASICAIICSVVIIASSYIIRKKADDIKVL